MNSPEVSGLIETQNQILTVLTVCYPGLPKNNLYQKLVNIIKLSGERKGAVTYSGLNVGKEINRIKRNAVFLNIIAPYFAGILLLIGIAGAAGDGWFVIQTLRFSKNVYILNGGMEIKILTSEGG